MSAINPSFTKIPILSSIYAAIRGKNKSVEKINQSQLAKFGLNNDQIQAIHTLSKFESKDSNKMTINIEERANLNKFLLDCISNKKLEGILKKIKKSDSVNGVSSTTIDVVYNYIKHSSHLDKKNEISIKLNHSLIKLKEGKSNELKDSEKLTSEEWKLLDDWIYCNNILKLYFVKNLPNLSVVEPLQAFHDEIIALDQVRNDIVSEIKNRSKNLNVKEMSIYTEFFRDIFNSHLGKTVFDLAQFNGLFLLFAFEDKRKELESQENRLRRNRRYTHPSKLNKCNQSFFLENLGNQSLNKVYHKLIESIDNYNIPDIGLNKKVLEDLYKFTHKTKDLDKLPQIQSKLQLIVDCIDKTH